MDYRKKYLKYKIKYLNLKGGALNNSITIHIKTDTYTHTSTFDIHTTLDNLAMSIQETNYKNYIFRIGDIIIPYNSTLFENGIEDDATINMVLLNEETVLENLVNDIIESHNSFNLDIIRNSTFCPNVKSSLIDSYTKITNIEKQIIKEKVANYINSDENNTLDLSNLNLYTFPKYYEFEGNLNLSNNTLFEVPNYLNINGNLNLKNNRIKEFTNDDDHITYLKINGTLELDTDYITSIDYEINEHFELDICIGCLYELDDDDRHTC